FANSRLATQRDTEPVGKGSSGDRQCQSATGFTRYRQATDGDRCREWRFKRTRVAIPVYFSSSRLAIHNVAWRQCIL
ncbi:hypothetical protein A2U01_0049121, partial [Trifolium medium]|nr:hypothetical protein [Trifolium medium]